MANGFKRDITAQRPGESDAAYLKRLGKIADTRMARLRDLSNKPGFKSATDYAYKRAQYDLQTVFGGANKFERTLKSTGNPYADMVNFNARVNALKNFIDDPTSTKSGIERYSRAANTINDKYGAYFSWDDIANFYGREKNKILEKQVSSKTLLRAIGFVKRHDLNGIRDIERWEKMSQADEFADQEVIEAAKQIYRTSTGRRRFKEFIK